MIVFGAMVPHPPILVPGIGKGEQLKIEKTTKAMEKLSEELALAEPDTIVFITPHTLLYPDLFNVCGMPDLLGNFTDFGYPDFQWEGSNDLELANEICDKSEDEGVPALLYNNGDQKYQLDHGVLVPLYFFQQKLDFPSKILPIGYTNGTRSEHFVFGQILREICEKRRDRIAIIASGDLSHRLKLPSENDSQSIGAEFDEKFLELMKVGDEYSIVNMDLEFVETAGECGYRSALILLGAFSGTDYQPEIYSYEGPFGVGYGVINLNIKN